MVKRKSCLTPLYTSPPSDDVGDVGDGNVSQILTSVDKIVSALFHEYDGLMHISETISAALTPLVRLQFAAVGIEVYCSREIVTDI